MLTNKLLVDLVQTNFVRAYKTNFQALNLTNWTTVLAFKTNWVTQPVTNLVEIEMTAQGSDGAPQAKSAVLENAPSSFADTAAETLVIEATRNARVTTNNQVEVHLAVNWSSGPEVPVQVQQWRVERDDRSILCFGQDREFKRALPVGTYNVQIRAQRDASSPLTVARGTLTITAREVLIAQRPLAKKSSI
jgi:hypothetical protein